MEKEKLGGERAYTVLGIMSSSDELDYSRAASRALLSSLPWKGAASLSNAASYFQIFRLQTPTNQCLMATANPIFVATSALVLDFYLLCTVTAGCPTQSEASLWSSIFKKVVLARLNAGIVWGSLISLLTVGCKKSIISVKSTVYFNLGIFQWFLTLLELPKIHKIFNDRIIIILVRWIMFDILRIL